MGRNPIKENQNPYFRARKQAAEWDARLESRERASELIGIAAYTLADYELGNVKRVPADKVLIMADLYNAPWLLSNYCKNESGMCRNTFYRHMKSLEEKGIIRKYYEQTDKCPTHRRLVYELCDNLSE